MRNCKERFLVCNNLFRSRAMTGELTLRFYRNRALEQLVDLNFAIRREEYPPYSVEVKNINSFFFL